MTATAVPDQHVRDGARDDSRRRRIAFRVLSVLMALTIGPLMLFGISELVLMWLPEATVLSIIDDPALGAGDVDLHRVHFLSIGLVAAAYLPSLLVQLRRPRRHLASMTLLLAIPSMGLLYYAISGSLATWVAEDLVMLVPVVLLALLHPRSRELLRPLRFDRRMGVLAVVAALPWGVRVVSSVLLQIGEAPGDTHASMEHWATAALAASVIVVAATLGASRRDGWFVSAGVAVFCTWVMAAHSLAFPGTASSLPPVAAVAAILWGAVYAAAAVARRRSGPEVDPAVATAPETAHA